MKIEITGKTYNGSVNVLDAFTLSQVELIETAVFDMPKVQDGKVRLTDIDRPRIPAILACVDAWEIVGVGFPENVTIETFPLSPRRETHNLIEKIFAQIEKVYNGELDIPNA